MESTLAALTAFPTVIFSILMVAAVLYWLLVIFGALDLDLFHASEGGNPGHAGGHGHEHGADQVNNPSLVLEFLQVGKVPLTIIVSTFVFLSWSISFLGTAALRPLLPDVAQWLFAPALLIAAIFFGLTLSGWVLRPLAALFRIRGTSSAQDLVLKQVVVTSTTVDDRFGTARYDDPNGTDAILNVVCAPNHRLAKGESAVIVDYDRERGVYLIAPLPHTRPGFLASEPPALPPPTGETPPQAS